MSKVLAACFSATGVTALAAAKIAGEEKADLFEIRPEVPYTKEDLDYTVRDSRSNLEMADEACRPAILGRVEDMAGYDTIFLGFPIWWGREPGIIDTFLEAYDLKGKKIIPFCASAASGIEKAADHIRGIVGGGVQVDTGKKIAGDAAEEEIREWTRLLGL